MRVVDVYTVISITIVTTPLTYLRELDLLEGRRARRGRHRRRGLHLRGWGRRSRARRVGVVDGLVTGDVVVVAPYRRATVFADQLGRGGRVEVDDSDFLVASQVNGGGGGVTRHTKVENSKNHCNFVLGDPWLRLGKGSQLSLPNEFTGYG